MTFTGICPRCGTDVPKDRFATGYAICQCGWTDSAPSEQTEKRSQKIVVAIMSFTSVCILVAFAQLMNWGNYAFTIPVVKLQQMTGTLSNDGYMELATVCTNLGKYTCAQNAYAGLFNQSQNPEALNKLAHLQKLIGNTAQAMATYDGYVKAGGKDSEAYVEYGLLLDDANRSEEALKMYETSITLRPDILPIRATSAIVRQLMKQGKYVEAYARINDFYKSAGNAKGYLNTEFAQLESYLGTSKERHSGKSSRHHSA
jgi:tetratricopeptide (TPR) repeat protein